MSRQSSDSLSHYHMFDFRARAAVAVTTETVREAQRRHGLDPITTIAVGRAISCAALLASTFKQGKEYVHCSFAGVGLLTKVVAECNGDGECRGYASPPRIMEDQEEGTPVPDTVGEAMGGAGMLTVTRGRPGEQSPYHAVLELQTGEIAADIARYLSDSEQIPSAVAAGVKLSPKGEVLAAGGVLVQRLGGAALEEAVLSTLESKMRSQLDLSDRLARGEDAQAVIKFLAGDDPKWGLLTTRGLGFKCTCSRDRMAATLMGLGEDQLQSIQEDVGLIEVRCQYCADSHSFQMAELIRQ